MNLPTDALFTHQWYLRNTTAGQFDLNVVPIWEDYTGAGIYVSVIDDAVQYNHSELSSVLGKRDHDFFDNDDDPSGIDGENDGTAIAGLIGANRDGTGTVGVAYGSTVSGSRVETTGTITDFATDAVQALEYSVGTGSPLYQADVVNLYNGQGLAGNYDLAPELVDLNTALDEALEYGRAGKGTIVVMGAGDKRQVSTSFDGDSNAVSWNSNIHSISVAAVDATGHVTSTSSFGSNILVSAFGAPLFNGNIVTTDRIGSEGFYNANSAFGGDYTSIFSGTQVAASMVSGVVALMLEANPGLGWRDVHEILAYSARHTGTDIGVAATGNEEYVWQFNNADNWNGGGLHFSRDYGFGLVDTYAAVRMAEHWNINALTTSNEIPLSTHIISSDETIDGVVNGGNTNNSSGTETYQWVQANDSQIEQVTVEVDFATTFLDDMEISITSADGTAQMLINDIGGANDFDGRWSFTTNAFWGESSLGNWSITIKDDAAGDELLVRDLVVTLHTGRPTNNNTYVFTDEFSDYAGTFGHSTIINDTDPGHDIINTAAVSSDTTINLFGLTGIIDGVNVSLSGIESAVTGDGDDHVIGSAGSNQLTTGRGDDFINAKQGSDIIHAGAGDDTIFFQGNFAGEFDAINGDDGVDTVDASTYQHAIFVSMGAHGANFRSSLQDDLNSDPNNWVDLGSVLTSENFIATAHDDRVYGNDADNRLEGRAGDDVLLGNDGVDTLIGGEGTDELNGGNGSDIASYAGSSSAVTVRLFNGTGIGGDAQGDVLISVENLVGSSFNDTLIGSFGTGNFLLGASGNDYLFGLSGNDSLYGGDGNDLLNGGAGADYLNGGQGVDTANYASSAGGVSVRLYNGIGTGNDAHGDTLIDIENVVGSGFDDALIGANGQDNVLEGGAGADYIDGLGGSDTASYAGSDASVTVRLFNGTGIGGDAAGDTLAHIENLHGSSHSDVLVGSNALANMLDGGDGNDSIFGLSGSDMLLGGQGNDLLGGGTGADLLDGGTGRDTAYYADSAGAVTVRLFNGTGSGNDAHGDSYISIENAIGSDYADALIGSYGIDNVLEGGAGADYLNGLSGIDTASYAGSSASVTVRLWNGTGIGGDANGDTLVNIENLIGSSHNDTLLGSNGVENVLNGGEGNDHMFGLTGDDTFAFNDNFGNDTIHDFDNGSEIMDMSASSLTAADLRIEFAGADTIVHFDQIDVSITDTITLSGVAAGIDASDFIF